MTKGFFQYWAFQLKESPLLEAEVSMHQQQSMILSLQGALQLEEVRVALTKLHKIYIRCDLERMECYRRAFSFLNSILVPKFLTLVLEAEPMSDVSTDCLASFLGEIFHKMHPLEYLKAAFKKVPEILLSKSDRIVAM